LSFFSNLFTETRSLQNALRRELSEIVWLASLVTLLSLAAVSAAALLAVTLLV
jgi:hypothetical protein